MNRQNNEGSSTRMVVGLAGVCALLATTGTAMAGGDQRAAYHEHAYGYA